MFPISEYTGKPKQFVRIKPKKPPQIGKSLSGLVVSHPHYPPGTEICTTNVQSIEGARVETRSSIYELC